jgi:phospholipid/cholesterol/gamma-HCH transport system permease protein
VLLAFVETLGDRVLYFLDSTGRMGGFLVRSLVATLQPPYRVFETTRQMHSIGARSLFVIVFAGIFTGMVLALQGIHTLQDFGSTDLVGSVVAIGLIRELGPVLTGILVTGRSGSAMCSEIGIMRTSEQIDALECMAVDPYRYVMAPKFAATLIAVPLLTAIFDVAGVIGAYATSVYVFGISEGAYLNSLYDGTEWSDVRMGIYKSAVFGLLIVWISTAKGFFIHLDRAGSMGSEGVGRVTTNAVVMASVAILVADYIITSLLML